MAREFEVIKHYISLPILSSNYQIYFPGNMMMDHMSTNKRDRRKRRSGSPKRRMRSRSESPQRSKKARDNKRRRNRYALCIWF